MSTEQTWREFRNHRTPQWLRDGKFGIYAHWGIYSVPACGPNGTWYPFHMYRPGNSQHDYHVRTYGPPEKFGYKDFIPMFTAEHFDAAEWAELFADSGAVFAGPVAEHHDGFSMWDSAVNPWNAARMGPKQDIVAQLADAIRAREMKFMVALHHAENWWFFNHSEKYDTADPAYAGLYGPPHDLDRPFDDERPWHKDWKYQERPNEAFLDQWLGKTTEIIDRFHPDLMWFDFGIKFIQEHYKREYVSYYYEEAARRGAEVAITYKHHDLVAGSGIIDLELGRFNDLTYMEWITDTTVDDGNGWCYLKDNTYKSPTSLIHYLVDNVSKNGYLLLNVDPMPNGLIPEPSQHILREIGRWMRVNGDAIYGTTPWLAYGEGPTRMEQSGMFSEGEKLDYTSSDFRFTAKGDDLYAICLAWPGAEASIGTLWEKLYPSEIESIRMLGDEQDLKWRFDEDALKIQVPEKKPCEHAFVFHIRRRRPFQA